MSIACNRLENNKQCATWRCRATPITGPNRDLRNKFARTEMKRNDLQKNSTHRAKEKTLQAQKKGMKKSELVKVNNRWFAMWTIAIVILVLCVGFFFSFYSWLDCVFVVVCGSCFYLCERIHRNNNGDDYDGSKCVSVRAEYTCLLSGAHTQKTQLNNYPSSSPVCLLHTLFMVHHCCSFVFDRNRQDTYSRYLMQNTKTKIRYFLNIFVNFSAIRV